MPASPPRRLLLSAMATTIMISTLFTAAPAGAVESPAPSTTASPTSSPAIEPSETTEASQTVEPTATVEPTTSAEPTSPVEPTTSAEPTTSVEPTTTDSAVRLAAAEPIVTTAAPVAAPDLVVDAAARWLAGQLSGEGTVTGSFPDGTGGTIEFTDWGRTLDSALALLAAGTQDAVLERSLTSVESAAALAEYTQGAPFDRADAAYVGATAKLAFVVELTGGDATDVAGVDLLAQLLSLERPDGRFEDRSDFGDFANVFGHAFAVLALDTAGRTLDPQIVDALLATQCADGSFPAFYPMPGSPCTGGVDATGLVLQALAAVDLTGDPDTLRAVAWLLGQQQPDGSFPGEAPVNSTGYAVLGLNAVGAPTGGAVAYLVSQQNADGGLQRGAGEDTSSDLFATAQALPALAGTTFQGSARDVRAVAEPAPTEPTPTPSPTAVATASPSIAPAPAAVDSSPAPAPAAAAAPAPAAKVRSAGSNLPRTGADSIDALLVGVVLVAVGGTILSAARPRRRGRHEA